MRPRAAFAVSLCGLLHTAALAAPGSVKDAVMADPGGFAAQIEAQIRRDDGPQAPALQGVQRLVVPSSQWRLYARGRGVLIAIPVRRGLLAREKSSGEDAVRDIVERMIRQRDLAGPVELLFIEPVAPAPAAPALCEPECRPPPCHCGGPG